MRRSSTPISADVAPAEAPLFAGLVGGTAEWVFKKREVVSVTVSAADRLLDEPAESLAGRLWRDVAAACRIANVPVPPARIVKERRATFRATPAQLKRRPNTATRWNNLHLAGDYVDTGLPATIEGAIRSGFAAEVAPVRSQLLYGRYPGRRCGGRRHPRNRQRIASALCHDPGNDGESQENQPIVSRGVARARPRTTRSAARPRVRCCRCSTRTAIGCSSWRPMRRSRPNTSCCSIISARIEPDLRTAHRALSPGHPGRPMADGRCFTAALSTSALRSRPISR